MAVAVICVWHDLGESGNPVMRKFPSSSLSLSLSLSLPGGYCFVGGEEQQLLLWWLVQFELLPGREYVDGPIGRRNIHRRIEWEKKKEKIVAEWERERVKLLNFGQFTCTNQNSSELCTRDSITRNFTCLWCKSLLSPEYSSKGIKVSTRLHANITSKRQAWHANHWEWTMDVNLTGQRMKVQVDWSSHRSFHLESLRALQVTDGPFVLLQCLLENLS